MWRKAALVFGPLASMLVLAAFVRLGKSDEPEEKPEPPPASKSEKSQQIEIHVGEKSDDEDGDVHASVELGDLSSFVLAKDGDRLVIAGNNGNGQRHCEPNANVWVAGNNNHYVIDGACGQINLTGNNNDLIVEQVDRVKLAGNNNEVGIGKVEAVAVMGNDNSLRYRLDVDGGPPKLTETGRNNSLVKEETDEDAPD